MRRSFLAHKCPNAISFGIYFMKNIILKTGHQTVEMLRRNSWNIFTGFMDGNRVYCRTTRVKGTRYMA